MVQIAQLYENASTDNNREKEAWIDNIVIVIYKFLKRHTKAKRRAPAYSRALRQIRGIVQRIVLGRLRSGFQRVRGGRLTVNAGVV